MPGTNKLKGEDFRFEVSVQDQFDPLLFGLGGKKLNMEKAKLLHPMAVNASLYSKTPVVPHARQFSSSELTKCPLYMFAFSSCHCDILEGRPIFTFCFQPVVVWLVSGLMVKQKSVRKCMQLAVRHLLVAKNQNEGKKEQKPNISTTDFLKSKVLENKVFKLGPPCTQHQTLFHIEYMCSMT